MNGLRRCRYLDLSTKQAPSSYKGNFFRGTFFQSDQNLPVEAHKVVNAAHLPFVLFQDVVIMMTF